MSHGHTGTHSSFFCPCTPDIGSGEGGRERGGRGEWREREGRGRETKKIVAIILNIAVDNCDDVRSAQSLHR